MYSRFPVCLSGCRDTVRVCGCGTGDARKFRKSHISSGARDGGRSRPAAWGVIIENSKAAHADANNDGKCDTCEYNVGTTTTDPGNKPSDDTTKPEDTNKPSDDVQSPQTGGNSMMWLWVTLLFVSGEGTVGGTYTLTRVEEE